MRKTEGARLGRTKWTKKPKNVESDDERGELRRMTVVWSQQKQNEKCVEG